MWFHGPPKTCTTHSNRTKHATIIVYLLITKIPTTMGKSIISDITTDIKSTGTGSTSATSFSSSSGGRSTRKKWNNNNKPMTINIDTFKGANLELVNKVFVIGPSQASKYDEAYKALITYFGSKFDHRVSRAFK